MKDEPKGLFERRFALRALKFLLRNLACAEAVQHAKNIGKSDTYEKKLDCRNFSLMSTEYYDRGVRI